MRQNPGVGLRDATLADARALAVLHVRTFQETHGGGPGVAVREQQWRAKLASGDLVFCLLLEADQRLIGFASGQRHLDEPREYDGEFHGAYGWPDLATLAALCAERETRHPPPS